MLGQLEQQANRHMPPDDVYLPAWLTDAASPG